MVDEAYSQLVTRLPRSGVVREPNMPPRQMRELVSEFTLIHFDEGVSDWIRVPGRWSSSMARPSPYRDRR